MPKKQIIELSTAFFGALYDRTIRSGAIIGDLIGHFPYSVQSYTLKPKAEIEMIVRSSFPDIKSRIRIEQATLWITKNLPRSFEGEKYQKKVIRDIPQEVVASDVARVLLPLLKNKVSY